MISKTEIQRNLRELDSRYRKARTPKDMLYFSKLAIIELCGWIETSMDEIADSCARKYIKSADNLAIVRRSIKKIHGFHYDDHFRPLLINVIGMITWEKIEARFDPAKRDLLAVQLASLKTMRDSEAHTFIKGVTRIIAAPSVSIAAFNQVYPGLKELDNLVRKLKL